ncbi:MAG: flagellar basal-body MS-ring/collar protein FliF [Alphaproteobacteria bacterium]
MNGLSQTVRALGLTRLMIIAGVLVGLAVFFIFVMGRMSAPNMALLYGGLASKDAGEIAAKLDAMRVPYELAGDGSQILVPSEQVLRLRMSLAEGGLPAGGTVGYEIFDKGEAFGTTSLVQNVNMLRALEGELARTIGSLSPVAGARVHLVVPRREVFSRNEVEPSASIALKLRGANRLTRQQVAAIQNLVATAVPGLSTGRIAIIDDKGNLLARGDGDDPLGAGSAAADDHRVAFEERLARSIESMVEQIVGPGKVRAEVSADIDYDRLTTNDEVYDPNGQVIRSTQTIEEQSESKDAQRIGAVSAAENLPEAQQGGGDSASNSNRTGRTEEIVNYEISKTVRTHIREGGTMRRLSVAVLVDGTYTAGAEPDAAPVYQPRSEEELVKLTELIKGAVGFDEERGDSVEVVNMAFAPVGIEGPVEEAGFSMPGVDMMKVLEIIVIGFVSALVIMLVLRPLVNRLLSPAAAHEAPAGTLAVTGPDGAAMALPAPAAGGPQHVAHMQGAPERQATPRIEEPEESLIDLARVEGRVREATVKKVNEIVEKHPEEALNIVRNWLYTE